MSDSREEVYRQMSLACLDELHAAKLRIASLEEQLKAAREEIRRLIHYAIITEEAKNGDICKR